MVFGWNKKEFTKADHRGQEDARKEDGGRRQNVGDQINYDAHVT